MNTLPPNPPRILLVDLNNFARYPTISIGYLAAILRQELMEVEVFSPLSTGVAGVVREPRVHPWGLMVDRWSYWSAMSRNRTVKAIRNWLCQTSLHAPRLARETNYVKEELATQLNRKHYDAVFVSSYLIYYELCTQIALMCQSRNLPMVLGGPYFAQPEVRREWLGILGLTALVGGEVELYLGALTRAILDRQSLDRFPGVWTDDPLKHNAPPLEDLDAVPFPDFSDFPWSKYPNRLVPLTTGRGCSWGACTFCSDITGSAGRTYRSRSPQNVLDELRYQSRRFGTDLFVFTDPKLNSNLTMWDSLLTHMPHSFPGARWLGAVHIGSTRDHGLTRMELRAARKAGMVRFTTGLESGSQRMLDLMKKGTNLAVSSEVIRNAATEDISVRVTMILGYPGESAEDVISTALFLEQHMDVIERVVLNRFHIRTGTRIHLSLQHDSSSIPEVTNLRPQHRLAVVDHDFPTSADRAYRRAIDRVLQAAHRINCRPLRAGARPFDGVM